MSATIAYATGRVLPPTSTPDHSLPDDLFHSDCGLLTVRLSPYARRRLEQALWYAWGREDAGDAALKDAEKVDPLGNDHAFSHFAAIEAERYERQLVSSLGPIHDQYERFVAMLSTEVTP